MDDTHGTLTFPVFGAEVVHQDGGKVGIRLDAHPVPIAFEVDPQLCAELLYSLDMIDAHFRTTGKPSRNWFARLYMHIMRE